MAESIDKLLLDQKPSLVVWQTGTYDAVHGTDPEEFRASVSEGVEKLQAGGADVVLVNMQYSPRTESIVAIGAYADGMRWVSREREVPVFDRLAIMRHWYDAGQFDLYKATKDMKMAKSVHDCLGRALARHDHRRGAPGSAEEDARRNEGHFAFFSIGSSADLRRRGGSGGARARARACDSAAAQRPPPPPATRPLISFASSIRSSAWRSGSRAVSRSPSSPSVRRRPPAPARARRR